MMPQQTMNLPPPQPDLPHRDRPVLCASHVGFAYTPGNPVVIDVDADLMPGRITALVGPNAAGKSTLIRLLLGALKPDQGSLTLDDTPIHILSPTQRAKKISYVPQRAGVRFGFNVRQIIAMGRFAAREDSSDLIEEVMEQLALCELADRAFEELSGGQQQRVMLARAIAQSRSNGRIMLLDEPASNLDLRHAHETMSHLQSLTQQGLAVLVVVHDLNLALAYADDAWLMDRGRIVAAGTWQEVLTPPILEPVYGIGLKQIKQQGMPRPALLASPAAQPGAV